MRRGEARTIHARMPEGNVESSIGEGSVKAFISPVGTLPEATSPSLEMLEVSTGFAIFDPVETV